MPRQMITNDAGEPIGYEEIPTQQEQQEAEYERQLDDNGPDGVTCPKCGLKMLSEDAYDYAEEMGHEGSWMCFRCDTKI